MKEALLGTIVAVVVVGTALGQGPPGAGEPSPPFLNKTFQTWGRAQARATDGVGAAQAN